MKVAVYWSHSFLPDLIRRDGVVFDFGLNDGGFTRLVAPLCKRVIAFEPDPTWQGRLSLPDNAHVEWKALAAKAGQLKLHVNRERCSSLHFTEDGSATATVEAVTLSEALALSTGERIDLMKIDIEGEELPVLRHAPVELFASVVQIAVEFHDFLDPSSLPEIQAVIARMDQIGFHAVKFSWRSYGDVLFISKALAPLSLMQRAWLLARFKYARGIGRIIERMLRKPR